MYVKKHLQPRDRLNKRHKEVYSWEIDWNTTGEFFQRVSSTGTGAHDREGSIMNLDSRKRREDETK